MRKLFLVAVTIATINPSSAIRPYIKHGKLRADQVMIPVNRTGKMLSLAELSTIKVGELEQLTGQHLNFLQTLGFKAAQKNLRNSINYDGTINNKKFQKWLSKGMSGESGFHLGGFALGLFLSAVGVLICYLINDDYKQNRVKWAWIGAGINAAIVLIARIALIAGG